MRVSKQRGVSPFDGDGLVAVDVGAVTRELPVLDDEVTGLASYQEEIACRKKDNRSVDARVSSAIDAASIRSTVTAVRTRLHHVEVGAVKGAGVRVACGVTGPDCIGNKADRQLARQRELRRALDGLWVHLERVVVCGVDAVGILVRADDEIEGLQRDTQHNVIQRD